MINIKFFIMSLFSILILSASLSLDLAQGVSHFAESIPIQLALKISPIALKKFSNPEDQIEFIRGYGDGYKFSLIMLSLPKNYYSSVYLEQTTYSKGYRLGRNQGFEDIDKNINRCSLIDFGYTPVSLKGTFTFGFENSTFNASDGNAYWVKVNKNIRKTIIEKSEVSVSGYLSPEGIYGHMGANSKELIVFGIK